MAWFRRGSRGKARDFNWHNVIGLWIWLPLFLVVLSGVVISYPWAGDLLFRLTGEEPPPARDAAARGRRERRTGRGERPWTSPGLDELWARAEQQVPGWRSISLRLPERRRRARDLHDPARRPGPPRPARAAHSRPHERRGHDLGALRRARASAAGCAPGCAGCTRARRAASLGQTLAGIASAGAAVLVWTGLALAWRRFFPRRKKATVERPV